jgi:glycosyltransferase involved in cell wall biosynthesis
MRIVWAHNWFLDYRVPVFEELSRLTGNNLFVLYNKESIPQRVSKKVQATLGKNAIPFTNEKQINLGNSKRSGDFANKYISLKYQPGLYSKIRELKPDVIVGEGFFRWGLTNLAVRARHGVPYVMLYERTMHTERNVKKPVALARKAMLRWFDVICCNGEQSEEYIRSIGFDPARITHRHMVADIHRLRERVSKFADAERRALKTELGIKGRVYIYIGQLMPRKGLRELLSAWDTFTSQNPQEELHLLVLGEGLNRDEYENQASRLPNVQFLGKVDYDQIHRFLGIADVSVTPTLEDNWSLVVPEAMAAGLPVLTTIYNGCYPELVTPQNGWVCDPLDPRNFADTMQKTLVAPTTLASMGTASWKIVSHHSPEVAAQAIYDSCRLAIKHRSN